MAAPRAGTASGAVLAWWPSVTTALPAERPPRSTGCQAVRLLAPGVWSRATRTKPDAGRSEKAKRASSSRERRRAGAFGAER